jgi:hypothetical protein
VRVCLSVLETHVRCRSAAVQGSISWMDVANAPAARRWLHSIYYCITVVRGTCKHGAFTVSCRRSHSVEMKLVPPTTTASVTAGAAPKLPHASLRPQH